MTDDKKPREQTRNMDEKRKGRARRSEPGYSKPTPIDVSIMGTNDSSIVSKRSVEMLYHAEPHFFKHFVKKPKRRAPLINRGYWLRMRAIEHALTRFLDTQNGKRKVVVNLGCGYDPLPFQMLSKHSVATKDVTFVDVDYPDLMGNKVAMIQAAPEILAMLPELRTPSQDGLSLFSSNYVALGCDLIKLQQLQSVLESFLNLSDCSICFIAEVSVTYMKEKAADALIRWAAGLPDSHFIQLEQCLPYGEGHPFAQTMLNHFAGLGTKLRSLKNYATEEKQTQRFRSRGWTATTSRSLWKLWAQKDFMSPGEKASLDDVEPFDEWEEFALFTSHYFILTANNTAGESSKDIVGPSPHTTLPAHYVPSADTVEYAKIVNELSQSTGTSPLRFAASYTLNANEVAIHGGHGLQSRLSTIDRITRNGSVDPQESSIINGPSTDGRMSHTITQLEQSATNVGLLVGGRTSPDHALSDCYLLTTTKDGSSTSYKSTQVPSLPEGLYRHSSLALTDDLDHAAKGVLVFGGKLGRAQISDRWLYWCYEGETEEAPKAGPWRQLKQEGVASVPRFGANLILVRKLEEGVFSGVLIGGIGADRCIVQEPLEWIAYLERDVISIRPATSLIDSSLSRFGATVVSIPNTRSSVSSARNAFALIGGVTDASVPPTRADTIVRLDMDRNSETFSCSGLRIPSEFGPLLIGHTATFIGDGSILVAGGGATCFSFGSYHNNIVWVFRWIETNGEQGYWTPVAHRWLPLSGAAKSRVEAERNADRIAKQKGIQRLQNTKANGRVKSDKAPMARNIKRITPGQLEVVGFKAIIEQRNPVILESLDLGHSIDLWTLDYLKGTIGADRDVVIHASSSSSMDFQSKNFAYKKMGFGQFLDEIADGGKHYLRALSAESASKPADIWSDYPELATDFKLPGELSSYIDSNLPSDQPRRHSSVLRVSGPVSMWLHYDVMSNVLCQVRGTKQLLLYPPESVRHLRIQAGQSSSSLDMFSRKTYKDYDLGMLRPLRVNMKPGDILFIPALWLHTAKPTSATSVAVNVFFRDLDAGYAAGRDVYGNRDVQAYEDGRRDVKRIEGRFAKLPPEMRKFYLVRLAQEFQDLAEQE